MKKLPTKKEAVMSLVDEAHRDRRRKNSFAKCSVALQVLGLDNIEAKELLHYPLELCSSDGTPYPPATSR